MKSQWTSSALFLNSYNVTEFKYIADAFIEGLFNYNALN